MNGSNFIPVVVEGVVREMQQEKCDFLLLVLSVIVLVEIV
jgi:hypothetical protein